MTSIKDLQIFHRSLSDAFDARSEAARKSLETSKRNALAMPEGEIVEELIEGLGKATTDAERVKVVAKLKAKLDKKLAKLAKKLAKASPGTPAKVNGSPLDALLQDLGDIFVNETMRDVHKQIAGSFG
ncbi:hypothetical protein [Parasphingopyxis lamellibrachiae]|uniref:Uncharacterized protein n=1 Tax=Parasphingopyxis lamellibrachiae TaxID=680125 RepID=A0A3D9FBC4_9SPHN|nr:hypothetical protein [Parasphingopyxis lamellibrachiae]RED15129.1 hypothetical protein DFR46_0116 [Parasphingopyxis lamellibrachiae]